jgi:hypothetical protein
MILCTVYWYQWQILNHMVGVAELCLKVLVVLSATPDLYIRIHHWCLCNNVCNVCNNCNNSVCFYILYVCIYIYFYLFIKHAPLLCGNTTCCGLHVSFISGDAVTNIVSHCIPFTISFKVSFDINI